ncbi:hypothetical protein ACFO1B_12935 [Dactylosporangium siamense]|uniref:Uncharacterized protein n=1 Tax=Dactylosporangium siamense TaxID=685454 RepID=A0A919PVL4_9ACTN|nr:hypothetical protein [Dactylosporangium siamense]GIG49190.1 hypothetical protein Dsi01nite_072310 [Dactylosporangium siamense]
MHGAAYWLQYEPFANGDAHLVERDPRVHDLFIMAKFRLELAFLGRRWLLPHFGQDTDLALRARLAETATAAVAGITLGSLRGVPSILCDIDLPADWFRGPVDGLVGLRIITAGVDALGVVGRELGLGPIPMRSPGQDRRRDPYADDIWLFTPEPALVAAQRAAREAFDAVPPGHGVLCGRPGGAKPRWTARVVSALRAEPLSDPAGGEVHLWQIPPLP